MNESISLKKVESNIINKIMNDYKDYQIDNPGNYILFFAKKNSLSITIFFNKKKEYSILINYKQERDLNEFLNKYKFNNKVEKKTSTIRFDKDYMNTQIGSDEVGTGDFFGPIVVVASFVDQNNIQLIKDLGVTDSKKLDDNTIVDLGKKLIKIVDYSCLSLDNKKYNELYQKGYNINQIKVLLHNKALFNMVSKHKTVKRIYVDEFTNRVKYLDYIKNEKDKVTNFYQETKGEVKFISVAVSSVIARYKFLVYMSELNKKYNLDFPFGASDIVDKFASKLLKKISIKEFDNLVKKNFANYNRLTSNL